MEYGKERIIAALSEHHPWKDRIHFYDSVASTNTLARQMAMLGVPSGTVLIANEQTAGRGRLGRRFTSAPDVGIYMTVILKPWCDPRELMHLTCATAVAACEAVFASTGIQPKIKWTNDLVYEKRKLAGILTELVLSPTEPVAQYALIGIGINCNQTLADFPPELQDKAGSLRMVTGEMSDRSTIAAALIEAFSRMETSLLTEKDSILSSYRALCMTLGQDISVVRGDSVYYAKAVDIDPEGGLMIALPDGRMETVTSGEVSVRGMYGYIS